MEIVKFKKGKRNIYELEFDNGLKCKLYDDVIVKYNLIANKILDNQKLDEILTFNDSLGAYYESIKKINTKLRSEVELKKYLKEKEYSDDIIKNTIERLKKDGYLNREVYIKSFINDAYRFTPHGPEKIKSDLYKLGFNDKEIAPLLNQDYYDKVIRLIDKKIKGNINTSVNMFKQKLSNYLITNGYPKELFNEYLASINLDDRNSLRKEAIKLINKYQKKYDNLKLSLFIKDKLYKKGYNIDEVGEVINDLL